MTGAVGMITETHQADEIITGGDADMVFIARELLRSALLGPQGSPGAGRRAALADPVRIRRAPPGEMIIASLD